MITFAFYSNKGGVGKTTTAGMVIKYLAQNASGSILAIDADPSSNLNMVLGLDLEWTVGEIAVDYFDSREQKLTLGFHQTYLAVSPVSENIDNNYIKVFPNPSQDHLTINYDSKGENYSINIYNLSGIVLFRKNIISGKTNKIDIRDFPNGIMILELVKKNGEKFIYKINKIN